MKIIVISYNTARYLYRFRLEIILELLRRGHKVVTVAPRDEYSDKLASLGCVVYDIKMSSRGANPFVDLVTFIMYYKIYSRIKPDLALHFTLKPNIYGTLAAQFNHVKSINMITGLGTAFVSHSWMTKMVEVLYKFSQRSAEKILFQNFDDLKLFIDRGLATAEKARVIPSSGVNLSEFSLAPHRKKQTPIFLMVCRMIRDKGVLEFVNAARQLKSEYPNVRFQLLGQLNVDNRTAISKDQMDGWVAEGVVEYLGESEDVRTYIDQADCLVLPSYREGLSKILLEAAAMGRVVIASNVPGCRELVDDGISGYLCEPKNVCDLVSKLKLVLSLSSNDLIRMGLNGRIKIEREFDSKVIVAKYLAEIDEVLVKNNFKQTSKIVK